MTINIELLLKKAKVQILAVGILAVLLVQFFPLDGTSFFVILFKDLLIILVGYLASVSFIALLKQLNKKPIELVFVLLMLTGLVYLMIAITGSLSPEKPHDKIAGPTGIIWFFGFGSNMLVFLALAFWLVIQRNLFYLKQRKNLDTYHNVMIVFFGLTLVTALFEKEIYKDYQFIHLAFYVTSIILIVINSFRISWIAFLDKNEKKRLLILSTGIIVLSIMSIVTLADDESHFLKIFSPALGVLSMLISVYGMVYFGFLFFTTLFHLPTAEVFDRKTKEISSLQYFSKLINQALDPKELAHTTTELALRVCSVDAAWLQLEGKEKDVPVSPKNIGYLAAEKIRHRFTAKWGEDFSESQFLDHASSTMEELEGEKFYFSAVRPLRSHTGNNGYLYVARKGNLPFDSEERATFETFSDYVSIAFENSHLLSESIEKERLERELDVAREIQRKLIPSELPVKKELEISALFIPAFEVGGDYYDIYENRDEELQFIIADVSGKGISAAFIMAEVRGIFASMSTMIESPKELVIQSNKILQRSMDRKHFVTMIYGSIDFKTGSLRVVRAGHLPMLRYRDGAIEEITPGGIGLGLNFADIFSNALVEELIQLQDGDIYVLFTDGITEAKNDNMEDYGMERLINTIKEHHSLSSEELTNKIIRDVTLFTENGTQHDDITLMIFRWNKPNERSRS